MTHLRIPAIMLVALLASAAAFGTASAARPEVREDDDKFVLQNDFVSVWFQGKKPMLKVMPSDVAASVETATIDVDAAVAATAGAFEYKFTEVVEYRDVDGDGAPSNGEVVASLNLEKASAWTVERAESEDAIVLNLTLEAPVKLGKGSQVAPLDNVSLPEGDASVSLVFTIRSAASVIDAAGVNVTVPATSIKYDFLVNAWPFVNADVNRLALEMLVTGALEIANETGVETATVVANGTEVGALSWTTTALGTTAEGEQMDVPVRVAAASEVGGATRLVYTYDAEGLATLLHDPTIGTPATPEALQTAATQAGSSLRDVPAPGLLLAAAAVGAAALARRR